MPRGAGKYGRMYVGFEDLSSQGGVNEKGLWFDAFGLPAKPVSTAKGEIYPGDLQGKLAASGTEAVPAFVLHNVVPGTCCERAQRWKHDGHPQ